MYGGSDLLSASCLGAKVVPVQSEKPSPTTWESSGSTAILQWMLLGKILLWLMFAIFVATMLSSQKRAIPQ